MPFLVRLFVLSVTLEVYIHVRASKIYLSKFKGACRSWLLVSELFPDRVVAPEDFSIQSLQHTLVLQLKSSEQFRFLAI